MNFEKLRATVSTLADVGVVVGFVMVAIQLHQNTIALESNAHAVMTSAFLDAETTMIGDTAADALAISITKPRELTDAQIIQLWGYYATSLQPVAAAYQAYLENVVDHDAYIAMLQDYADNYLSSQFARIWWRHTADFIPTEFGKDIDAALAGSAAPERLAERFHSIRAELQSLQDR